MAQEKPLESKTDEAMEAVVAGRAPWGLGTLLIVAIFGTLITTGIIAGLNWRRMGHGKLMWLTIIGTITIFFILSAYIFADSAISLWEIGIVLAVVLGLFAWQRPYYQIWKQINPEAQQAGWQIPVVTSIVFQSLNWVVFFLMN